MNYVARIIALDGSAPVGTLTITDGSKVIATVEVTAEQRGRVTVQLPKLSRGVHVLRSSFDGASPYTDSRSFPVPMLVW